MRQPASLLLALGICGGLLLLADALLDPVPVPAATGAVAATLALWWTGSLLRAAAWLLAGVAAGLAVHLWVHASGGSPAPEEGLLLHLLLDGAWSAAMAAVIALLTRPFSRR